MQFKVPQNVQMEDKIVGPLTLKHMIILAVGGAVGYVVYIALARTYFWEVWLPPVAVVGVITVLFAFVKIYNVTFSRFILLFIQFIMLPRKRIWIKKSGDVFLQEVLIKQPTEAEHKSIQKSEQTKETVKKLKDISTKLDKYHSGNPNKHDE
ncbi:PrgI family protein [Candidatus Peregrinibacteria bacterium]|nr:PrgI family protein [Candidatus Peregrinibacteria bacterium]